MNVEIGTEAAPRNSFSGNIFFEFSALCIGQGGWAQHDFSLAWLEAARYFSEGGHGTTRNRSVQEILCKMCITVLP